MPKKHSYEELKKIWYKKLKESKSEEYPDGFQDIETPSGMLTAYSQIAIGREVTSEKIQDNERYYYLANCFLQEYGFESRKEEIIWEYHSNGMSVRSIAKLLDEACYKNIKKSTIANTIKRLRDIMMIVYFPTVDRDNGN